MIIIYYNFIHSFNPFIIEYHYKQQHQKINIKHNTIITIIKPLLFLLLFLVLLTTTTNTKQHEQLQHQHEQNMAILLPSSTLFHNYRHATNTFTLYHSFKNIVDTRMMI